MAYATLKWEEKRTHMVTKQSLYCPSERVTNLPACRCGTHFGMCPTTSQCCICKEEAKRERELEMAFALSAQHPDKPKSTADSSHEVDFGCVGQLSLHNKPVRL